MGGFGRLRPRGWQDYTQGRLSQGGMKGLGVHNVRAEGVLGSLISILGANKEDMTVTSLLGVSFSLQIYRNRSNVGHAGLL